MANEEKKIVIVSDDDKVIEFQDIVIKNDVVDRDEADAVEEKIQELEQQRISIDEELAELRAKIAYAKHIIEIADAQKQQEEVAEAEVSETEENEDSTVEE